MPQEKGHWYPSGVSAIANPAWCVLWAEIEEGFVGALYVWVLLEPLWLATETDD